MNADSAKRQSFFFSPRKVFFALFCFLSSRTTDALFIDYDCAFGSYTYDWNQVYDEIMNSYLGAKRERMDIPDSVSENVAALLHKGKHECPLGAMQISIMFYYYTLRDFELNLLRIFMGIRRVLIASSSGAAGKELLAGAVGYHGATEGMKKEGIPERSVFGLVLEDEVKSGRRVIADLLREEDADLKIRLSDQALSSRVDDEQEGEVNREMMQIGRKKGDQVGEKDPHQSSMAREKGEKLDMEREFLLDEMSLRPKDETAFAELLKKLVTYVDANYEQAGGDLVTAISLLMGKIADLDDELTGDDNSLDSSTLDEERQLLLALSRCLALIRVLDVNEEEDMRVQFDGKRMKIVEFVIRELISVSAAVVTENSRRKTLLDTVHVWSRYGEKDGKRNEDGYLLKYDFRSLSDSTQWVEGLPSRKLFYFRSPLGGSGR